MSLENKTIVSRGGLGGCAPADACEGKVFGTPPATPWPQDRRRMPWMAVEKTYEIRGTPRQS